MKCPRCQQENPPQGKFCLECGTPLGQVNAGGRSDASYTGLQHALAEAQTQIAEALDRQRATSEILRVISQSHKDVGPVFEAIVDSAVRLLRAYTGTLTRVVGEHIVLEAFTRTDAAGDTALQARFPVPLASNSSHALALRDRAPLNIADAEADQRLSDWAHGYARVRGYRSQVVVPLLRQSDAIGTISVTRREAGGFETDEIALLQTFADQAVIAIENVRLFTELQEKNRALTHAHAQVTETLEQQTATSEILRVISSSPTDLQPVLDTVSRTAARLCDAVDALIFRLDGAQLLIAAHHGPIPLQETVLSGGMPLTFTTVSGRTILEARRIHVDDLASSAEFPDGSGYARRLGYHTTLSVPLLRQGTAIGAITIRRREVRPFTDAQMDLLETFADQAVIAIENVRLFTELQEKNRAVTEALDQQTATSEILRVISSSPTDVRPVFDTLLRNAVQLCNAVNASLYRFDGQLIHLVANHNLPPALLGSWQRRFPRPLSEGEHLSEVLTSGAVMRIADVFSGEAAWSEAARDALRTMDAHSALFVPVRRQGQPIGAIALFHRDIGAFTDQHVALLETFADQAVIAIENVRLFKELEAANRELAAASQHKSEFLANMSHELRTPLNAVIGFSEVLSERMFGELNERQEEYLKDIHASGQHLLSLINDILDLSKIEAGRMELELTDFDLPTSIDNALTLVRERAGRRGTALQQATDGRLGLIRGDERKIKQVLLNLLSNAIKFTPDGGTIEVRAIPVDGAIQVSVTDTGVGIAPEDQEAIFEEFRQVGTADKKVEGTGLGLALSRKFIELHGGRIWVESQVREGSTFTFTIPVRRGE